MQGNVCETLWKRPIRGAPRSQQKMALEMEMLAYDSENFLALGLPGARVNPQILLERLSKIAPHSKLKIDSETQLAIGLELENGANFSIEPGGQVEYSSAPALNLSELTEDVVYGLELLERAAQGELLFASHGTNPTALANMGMILPKSRYQTLRRYFLSQPQGRGAEMMLHTCTVQPNLDIAGPDEAWNDAVNLTFLLTPFARHLFSNSRYFKNEPSKFISERQAIWEHTDPTRSGIPLDVPFSADVACAYAQWARQAYVFLVPQLEHSQQPLFGELTFAQWLENGYKGVHPTLADWETHLGTLFPDLRLRNFLEVRCVDAQPFEHTLAVVSFWAGILQHAETRQRVWQFLAGIARTYVHCTSGSGTSSMLNSKADSDLSPDIENSKGAVSRDEKSVFRALMAEDPNHSLFQDARLHRHLLNIAIEGLVARNETLGVESLESYKAFLFQKAEYWQAKSADDFVRKISTSSPSQKFVEALGGKIPEEVQVG